jgi:hypothetical protein
VAAIWLLAEVIQPVYSGSYMKVVVWCLVLVGLYFLYQYTVGEVFREYERCYTAAEADVLEVQQSASESKLCVTRKLAYDEMVQCFTTLQSKNNLAGVLYDAAPVSRVVKKEFELHNEECPAHTITTPKMSIYLKTGSSL